MKTFEGITVTIRDKDGNQVLGLDSKYAPELIERHGIAGSWSSRFGDYSIEIVAYSEHQNRLHRWIHNLNNWRSKRQLMKHLRQNSKNQSRAERGLSDIPITTLSHPTGADFQSPLTLSSPRPLTTPPRTSDITKQRPGLKDDGTSPAESFSHDWRKHVVYKCKTHGLVTINGYYFTCGCMAIRENLAT